MKVTGVELRRIHLPLVAPFRTSFGTETCRDVLLVRVVTDDAEGWGECVAMSDPLYSSEYVDGAPTCCAGSSSRRCWRTERLDANAVAPALARVQGPPDGQGRARDGRARRRAAGTGPVAGGVSSAQSASRVACGVSVGIMDSIGELLDAVDGYVDEGYRRIKLKIEPGWDVEPVAAVRERFGDDLLLQVDANTAYTLADAVTWPGSTRSTCC